LIISNFGFVNAVNKITSFLFSVGWGMHWLHKCSAIKSSKSSKDGLAEVAIWESQE
jgi:hypothetical protein